MTDSGAVVRTTKRRLDWVEITQHDKQEDCWLVLEGKVYDVTKWARHHPGGRLILSYHAGRDATVCSFITSRGHLNSRLKIMDLLLSSIRLYSRTN